MLPPGSEYLVLDPNKINRARDEVMGQVQKDEKAEILEGEVKAIIIDSRITKSKVAIIKYE